MDKPAELGSIITIIERIIGVLAPIAALAFFVMLLVGGFQLVTSGGDAKAAGHAKSTLTYAFLGVVLVVAAWLILQLIKDFTGADVTKVELPS